LAERSLLVALVAPSFLAAWSSLVAALGAVVVVISVIVLLTTKVMEVLLVLVGSSTFLLGSTAARVGQVIMCTVRKVLMRPVEQTPEQMARLIGNENWGEWLSFGGCTGIRVPWQW